MKAPRPPFWRGVLALLALQALGVALYARLTAYPVVWDDSSFVVGEPYLEEPDNLRRVLSPAGLVSPPPGVRSSARPLWLASVMIDRALFGRRVFAGMRLMSVLWHALGALLLTALAWRLTGRRLTALVAGLLFVVHPVHVENVAIVTYRADLMAFAFSALALYLYIEARTTGWRRAACLFGAAAAFVAAMLSKESAVVTPLLALLCDVLLPDRSPRRWSRDAFYGACALLLIAYIVFHTPRAGYRTDLGSDVFSQFQAAGGRGDEGPSWRAWPWLAEYYASPVVRLRTSLAIFADEARLLLWPARLQLDYAPRPPTGWSDGAVAAGALLLVAALAGAWRLRRAAPVAALGVSWTLVSLVPVSGLFFLYNLEAERYLYFASAGVCLAAAEGLRGCLESRRKGACRVAAAVLTAALGLGAWRVVARVGDFRDSIALHEATVRADPGVPRAHAALGAAYRNAGRVAEAREAFRRALAIWPAYPQARRDLENLEVLAARRP